MESPNNIIREEGKKVVIDPPSAIDETPMDKEFRVLYSIDFRAKSPQQAAQFAEAVLRNPSYRPCFQVIDSKANVVTVDLQEG